MADIKTLKPGTLLKFGTFHPGWCWPEQFRRGQFNPGAQRIQVDEYLLVLEIIDEDTIRLLRLANQTVMYTYQAVVEYCLVCSET